MKVLDFIKENIERNEKGFATISKKTMLEKLDYEKMEDLNNDLSELIKNKELYFMKENFDSLQKDGTITTFSNIKYFVDADKFVEYNREKTNKNIEMASIKIDKEYEKLEKLKGLSHEAKYIYELTNKALMDRGYVDNKEILSESNLLWNNFKEAQDELINNKLVYLLKMENEVDKKFVLIKEDRYFAQLYEKEKEKEEVKVEKEERPWKRKKEDKEMER
ncbi:hypothetical protein [Streptobacillus moniliformis]|uniref:hypothetical protein n=1 Tax=Streptobacillus moniliformis TaxID=34105 RepID=UPI0007E3DDF4|nr:hypothetical protein [Streptobacillus moniliformis]